MGTIGIIINNGSGSQDAEHKLNQLRQAFLGLNMQPEFFLAHGGEAIMLAVEKALTQGHKIICAAGGDGTVSAVATGLFGTGATLGIIPLGTLNHLAKDLGIPENITGAVEVLVLGEPTALDAGSVNGKLFLNNSSIGLYPKLVRHRQEHEKAGKGKFLALVMGIISVARNYSLLKVRMSINNREFIVKTPFVFVGNNEYKIEGLSFGSRQNINKGHLSVYIVHRPSRFNLVALAFHALWGTLRSHQDFDAYKAKELFIDSKKKLLTVSLDGEIETLATPLHYEILPGVLQVMAPKN